MKTLRFTIITSLFLLVSAVCWGQGSGGPTCGVAVPFCTADPQLVEPFDNCFNGTPDPTCTNSGEGGINYGCLGSTPFPTWYFLQIDQTGDLEFQITQNTSFQYLFILIENNLIIE